MTTTWEQLHSSEGMAKEKRTVVLPACGMPVHRVCGHVIRAIVQHAFLDEVILRKFGRNGGSWKRDLCTNFSRGEIGRAHV